MNILVTLAAFVALPLIGPLTRSVLAFTAKVVTFLSIVGAVTVVLVAIGHPVIV
ncbi:MAG TPA: hypothetical protein VF834_15225 [Streptosporangiaceae bacterium]